MTIKEDTVDALSGERREGVERASFRTITAYSEIICHQQQELGCRLWNAALNTGCAPHVLQAGRAAQTVIPNGCGPAGGLLFWRGVIALWQPPCARRPPFCSNESQVRARRRVRRSTFPAHIILVREGHSASPDRSTSGVEVRPRIHVSCKHRDGRPPSPHTRQHRTDLSFPITASLGPPQTIKLGVGTAPHSSSATRHRAVSQTVARCSALHCCSAALAAEQRAAVCCVLCAAVAPPSTDGVQSPSVPVHVDAHAHNVHAHGLQLHQPRRRPPRRLTRFGAVPPRTPYWPSVSARPAHALSLVQVRRSIELVPLLHPSSLRAWASDAPGVCARARARASAVKVS